MSKLRYNTVDLTFLHTKFYSFGTERDPSNADTLWDVYEVMAEGAPLNTGGGLASPTTDIIKDIQHKLGQPMKAIRYEMNAGVVVFETTGIDAAMGPEVVAPPRITAVNSGVMLIEVHYRVRVRNCGEVGKDQDPVVSLRWKQTESYNETWTLRLSTSGRLIVRSDLKKAADSFRDLTTPNILNDFVRLNSRYTLSDNGTELAFEFEDEQRDRMPPYPAVKASGKFAVRVDKGQRTGHCEVSLVGAKGTSRRELLVVAMRICLSKLDAEGVAFHSGASFSEDLFEPAVTVSMQGMLQPLAGGMGAAFAGLALGVLKPKEVRAPAVFPTVGEPPAGVGDNKPGIAPPTRGRITALLAAAFRDPCAAKAMETELRTDPGGLSPLLQTKIDGGVKSTGYSLSVGTLPPFPGPPAVADAAPYDHYHVESTYTFEAGKTHNPGTGAGPNGMVSSITTLHGGRMQLVVAWAAVRSGTPPVLPAYRTQDTNLEPLDAAITLNNIEMQADGVTPVYAVGGWYLYAVLDPRLVSVVAPLPPFLSAVVGQAVPLAAAYSSAEIIRFQGAKGPNPFAESFASQGTPDNQLVQQIGGSPPAAQIVLVPGDQPPPGGLDTPGGQTGYLGGQTVNP